MYFLKKLFSELIGCRRTATIRRQPIRVRKGQLLLAALLLIAVLWPVISSHLLHDPLSLYFLWGLWGWEVSCGWKERSCREFTVTVTHVLVRDTHLRQGKGLVPVKFLLKWLSEKCNRIFRCASAPLCRFYCKTHNLAGMAWKANPRRLPLVNNSIV